MSTFKVLQLNNLNTNVTMNREKTIRFTLENGRYRQYYPITNNDNIECRRCDGIIEVKSVQEIFDSIFHTSTISLTDDKGVIVRQNRTESVSIPIIKRHYKTKPPEISITMENKNRLMKWIWSIFKRQNK